MTDSRLIHSRDEFAEVFPDYYSPTEQIRIGRLVEEDRLGDARWARAATPSGPSLLRVSGITGIAIAAFCIIYFAWQFVR